jgi:uroporphyrinogen decarboxylase
MAGPIQNRHDFEAYPWDDIPRLFWNTYGPQLEALGRVMPEGMKAVGGCGYGVFEVSEDLVGFENLCVLLYDDPELFADLYLRIGDLQVGLWTELLRRYGDLFAVCRMGDDMGFKAATLLPPDVLVRHVMPQLKRIVALAHQAGKPFLWHSCGCIFEVMEAAIAAGINAKHSNEDQIAPFDLWIEKYSKRIGLFGGIDVNDLGLKKPQEIFESVVEKGKRFRAGAMGYALGSGNSIPDYIPVDGYLAMVEAAKKIRADE